VLPTAKLEKPRLAGETLAAVVAIIPERAIVWGLPGALSVMVTVAVRVPAAVGLKATLIVHSAPAATAEPQLFDVEKSPAFEPEIAILVRLKLAFPELARVRVCAGVPVPTPSLTNERLVGVSVAAGATPVPFILVRAEELLFSVRSAVRVPEALGLKMTLIVQLAPAAKLFPQSLDWEKSPALVPVNARLVMSSEPLPELLKVTDWGELAAPTFCLGTVKAAGERVGVAAESPVPLMLALPPPPQAAARRAIATPSAPTNFVISRFHFNVPTTITVNSLIL